MQGWDHGREAGETRAAAIGRNIEHALAQQQQILASARYQCSTGAHFNPGQVCIFLSLYVAKSLPWICMLMMQARVARCVTGFTLQSFCLC